MHFSKVFTASLLLVATGVSAMASPAAAAVADVDFKPIGRRISRKAIERRHWRHRNGHGRHNATSTTTDAAVAAVPTDAASDTTNTTTTDNGDDSSCDGDDEPVTITIYTTITSAGDAAPTDAPTETDTDTDGTPTETVPAPTSSSGSSGNGPSDSGATIVATGSQCGDPNAVPSPAPTSGPNGDENWLNCGVDGAGWVPPPVTLDNLIYRDLAEVLNEDGNPFSACSSYLSIFQQMASETGIPEIFLASISLQESGCNPSVTGGAGEIGMMQITSEKCPTDGSDCYDAATNIRIGAEYFKGVIDNQCNGNVACAMGAYNGWQVGLTVESANNYAICAQHNNLDYLQNVFNGYLQGVDPSTLGMGIYHNTC